MKLQSKCTAAAAAELVCRTRAAVQQWAVWLPKEGNSASVKGRKVFRSVWLSVRQIGICMKRAVALSLPYLVSFPTSPLCGKLIPTHALSQTVNARSRYVLDFSNQRGVVVLEKLILQVNLPSAPALLPPFHIMTVRNPLYLQGRALKSIYIVFALNIHCVCTE